MLFSCRQKKITQHQKRATLHTTVVGTGYCYTDLPGLGNNNGKIGLPERLSTGIQFRFRNLFH